MHLMPETQFPKLKGAYIVGGSIRDLMLGCTPADYDIAVLGEPAVFAQKIGSMISGRVVKLGRPGESLYRIVSDRMTVDISQTKGETIEADLGRRDFTINAMAYDLSQERFIDPFGGAADLARKIIRMVSNRVFSDDPVRLLRAFRLAALLDFKIDPETDSRIRQDASRIRESAGERIRDELIRLFGCARSFPQVSRMADNGLINSIIPEFSTLLGCSQNTHHEYDVRFHTLEAFYQLEQILNSLKNWFPKHLDGLNNIFYTDRGALLKWAILLHDIEKPSARTEDADGCVHFYRHEKKSAVKAEEICRRIRFSNHETAFIKTVIFYHMRPLFLFQAHLNNQVSSRAITRFFMASKEDTPAVLLHAAADFRGKKTLPQERFDTFIKQLMNRYYSEYQPKRNSPRLITGRDLIHEFGLKPSPEFKDILLRIEEARLSNRISTRKEALALVERLLLN